MILERSLEILCSPRVLWLFLEEPAKMKLWLKGLQDVVPVSDGPKRAGATFKLHIKEGGKKSVYDEEILVYEPGRALSTRLTAGSLPAGTAMRVDYRLMNEGGSTRLEFACSTEVRGFARFLAAVFKPLAALQLRGHLKRLKRLAEEAQLQPRR